MLFASRLLVCAAHDYLGMVFVRNFSERKCQDLWGLHVNTHTVVTFSGQSGVSHDTCRMLSTQKNHKSDWSILPYVQSALVHSSVQKFVPGTTYVPASQGFPRKQVLFSRSLVRLFGFARISSPARVSFSPNVRLYIFFVSTPTLF